MSEYGTCEKCGEEYDTYVWANSSNYCPDCLLDAVCAERNSLMSERDKLRAVNLALMECLKESMKVMRHLISGNQYVNDLIADIDKIIDMAGGEE